MPQSCSPGCDSRHQLARWPPSMNDRHSALTTHATAGTGTVRAPYGTNYRAAIKAGPAGVDVRAPVWRAARERAGSEPRRPTQRMAVRPLWLGIGSGPDHPPADIVWTGPDALQVGHERGPYVRIVLVRPPNRRRRVDRVDGQAVGRRSGGATVRMSSSAARSRRATCGDPAPAKRSSSKASLT